jgi:hypothetical protein
MRPGTRLRAWALRWLHPTAVEHLVDPILADLQTEYQDATASGQLWRARGVLLLSYVAFWTALILHGVSSPTDAGQRRVFRTATAASVVAFLSVTLLLVLPTLLRGHPWPGGPWSRFVLNVLLVPQILPLTLPIGLCVGVLYAMRGRVADRTDVRFVLALGFAATVFALILLQWLVPAANQEFRETGAAALSGRAVHFEPGLNELGLSRLGARADAVARRQYQLLLAICVAPPSLALLALGLSRFVRRAAVAVPLALLIPIGYWAVMFVTMERRPETWFAIVAAPWLPNLVFLAISFAFWRRARPRA